LYSMWAMQNIAEAIIYVVPAYIANGTPVVVLRYIKQSHPIDLGVVMWDGRRLLGDGKTIEGLVSGLAVGLVAALSLYVLVPGIYRSLLECGLLPVGAMMGDILGAFIKRRMGLERGRSAPVLDQIGFLLVALLLAWLPHGAPIWLDAQTFVILLVITALLHLSTNALAYLVGLKDKWY